MVRIFFIFLIDSSSIFIKLKDLETKFIEYLRFEKRYSQHTITAYQNDLLQFRQFISQQYDTLLIENIKRTHIRSWLAALSEEKVSSKSIHRKISTLSSFFKYLHRQGVVSASPMINITKPKTEKRLASFVRQDKIEQVLNQASAHKMAENISELNKQLIVEIFYQTGIRRSEMLGLTLANTDLNRRELKVLGKGNKERIIPINQQLSELIKHYLSKRSKVVQADNDKLIVLPNGKPLYPKYVYNVVNGVLKTSTTLKKNSPHILRHTFATHLLNEGADINAIKELLGHASLAATQIYTHNSIEKLKNVHKKAHPKS